MAVPPLHLLSGPTLIDLGHAGHYRGMYNAGPYYPVGSPNIVVFFAMHIDENCGIGYNIVAFISVDKGRTFSSLVVGPTLGTVFVLPTSGSMILPQQPNACQVDNLIYLSYSETITLSSCSFDLVTFNLATLLFGTSVQVVSTADIPSPGMANVMKIDPITKIGIIALYGVGTLISPPGGGGLGTVMLKWARFDAVSGTVLNYSQPGEASDVTDSLYNLTIDPDGSPWIDTDGNFVMPQHRSRFNNITAIEDIVTTVFVWPPTANDPIAYNTYAFIYGPKQMAYTSGKTYGDDYVKVIQFPASPSGNSTVLVITYTKEIRTLIETATSGTEVFAKQKAVVDKLNGVFYVIYPASTQPTPGHSQSSLKVVGRDPVSGSWSTPPTVVYTTAVDPPADAANSIFGGLGHDGRVLYGREFHFFNTSPTSANGLTSDGFHTFGGTLPCNFWYFILGPPPVIGGPQFIKPKRIYRQV